MNTLYYKRIQQKKDILVAVDDLFVEMLQAIEALSV